MKHWLFLALVVVACSSKHYDDDDDDGGASGDAGAGGGSSGGKGGSAGAGATSAKGGSGASTSNGGSNAQGGTDLVGGTSAGGDTGVGGDGAIGAGDGGMSGGEPAAEGGSGGSNGGTGGSNGGTGGTGGSLGGTGGTGGSAGQSSGGCDELSVSDDGYVSMPAQGACWHGYVISGKDNISSSSVYPDTWDTCGAQCQLAIIGTVAGGNGSTYAYLAFSLNEPVGGGTWSTVTPTGTGIKITHTYTSALTAYVEITSTTASYCIELPASGTTIPYSSFKTNCWDTTGTAYSKGTPIDAIQVTINGESDPGDFNLHITNIEEI